jgi:hypothetical protein
VINRAKVGLDISLRREENLEEFDYLLGGDFGELFEASASFAEMGAKHGGT